MRDYVLGRRIVLDSPLPKEDVSARIKAGTERRLSPVAVAAGVTGGVWFGHVRLVWSAPQFRNDFRPVFAGYLRESREGTTIKAAYGASVFLRFFYAFWYIVLTIIALISAVLLFQPNAAEDGAWLIGLVLPLLAIAPIAFHTISNRNANTHFEAMLDHLEALAELRPQTKMAR